MSNSWSTTSTMSITNLPVINTGYDYNELGLQRPKTLTIGSPKPNLNYSKKIFDTDEKINQINPFPDYTLNPANFRSGTFENNALNLALHTLGLTKTEYNLLTVHELKTRFGYGVPTSYAINILIHFKESKELYTTPKINPVTQYSTISPIRPRSSSKKYTTKQTYDEIDNLVNYYDNSRK